MRNRKLFLNYIEKKGGIVKKLQQILLLTDSAQNEEEKMKKVLSMMLAVIMFTSTSFCSIANELEDKGNADGMLQLVKDTKQCIMKESRLKILQQKVIGK